MATQENGATQNAGQKAEQEKGAAHSLAAPSREKIKGIFSSQEVRKVGAGTTVRKTIQKTFWMVEEQDDGSIQIQPLNVNYVPSGPFKTIPKDDLLQKFAPEPEFYVQTVFPKMQELEDTITRGDRHRSKGEHFSAELEYNQALAVDEDNVRANFGLGLTYLERGESVKADNIFERLVKLEAAFDEEHKHLFNDFGINLRKNKMFDQAVTYYKRAEELAKSDEHLQYNLARVYFERKDMAKARDHLLKALSMNPNLEVARNFLQWMMDKGLIERMRLPTAAAPSPAASGAAPGTASAPAAPAPSAGGKVAPDNAPLDTTPAADLAGAGE